MGGLTAAALVLAAPVQAAPADTKPLDQLVAQARSEGDLTRALSMLTSHSGIDADLRESAERYGKSLAKREEDRAAKVGEVTKELDEELAKVDSASDLVTRSIALADAMKSAVELQVLSTDESAFMADAKITSLITNCDAAAHQAEDAGEWMIANELYARLAALLDKEGSYKEDSDRLNQRLSMIRMYAPEKFRELVAQHRERHGEDAPPPYNPYGDTYQEKLAPVNEQAVERALTHAMFKHVDYGGGEAMGPMLVAGLNAIETLVTTHELADVFKGLADDNARGEFLRFVRSQRSKIQDEMQNGGVGLTDMNMTLSRMMSVNKFSVKLSEPALLHEFGNGAMTALDTYTAIIWPDELKRFQRSTRGEFVGVGIQIEMDDLQNIRVVTPLEGTPAQRAGVQTGDLIRKVDGHSTVGFTLDQAVEVITGPANTNVTLTVERGDDGDSHELDFTLRRARIELPTVHGWQKVEAGDDTSAWNWFVDKDAGIGYIRLTSFSDNTTQQFDEAIAQMRRKGLNGLVLDLRFNPGGLLDEAVSIANRFIKDGVIVKTEDADGHVASREFARRLPADKSLANIPVAVLINEGSASASEIVSGAIQAEAHANPALRATLVGRRSFGKGSVQNVFGLDDASMMKLTTQYYKLQGDKIIHRRPGASVWGIDPDINVEMLPDQIVEAAKIRRDADVLALDEDGRVVNDTDRPSPNKLLDVGVDLQLQTALVVLQGEIEGSDVAVTAAD